MGFGGMGHGGAGPVIQEPVDTGNPHIDKAVNKFYNFLSHTHEDPPTIQKTILVIINRYTDLTRTAGLWFNALNNITGIITNIAISGFTNRSASSV
jgi:hypothetical protein